MLTVSHPKWEAVTAMGPKLKIEIEDKQIYATINQKDGMVVVRDEPDKYGGPEVLRSLEHQLAVCMELDKQILAMDEDIQVNPLYVKKPNGVQDEEPSKMEFMANHSES